MSALVTILLGTASLATTSFFNYSPYTMKTTAPVSQWADSPIPLVPTPQHLTGKVRISSIAQLEACASNTNESDCLID